MDCEVGTLCFPLGKAPMGNNRPEPRKRNRQTEDTGTRITETAMRDCVYHCENSAVQNTAQQDGQCKHCRLRRVNKTHSLALWGLRPLQNNRNRGTRSRNTA